MIGTSPSLDQIVHTDASWRDCENMFHNGEPDCGQKRYRMIDTAPKTSNLLSDFLHFTIKSQFEASPGRADVLHK